MKKVKGKIGMQWVAGSGQQAAGGRQSAGAMGRCWLSVGNCDFFLNGNEKSPRAGGIWQRASCAYRLELEARRLLGMRVFALFNYPTMYCTDDHILRWAVVKGLEIDFFGGGLFWGLGWGIEPQRRGDAERADQKAERRKQKAGIGDCVKFQGIVGPQAESGELILIRLLTAQWLISPSVWCGWVDALFVRATGGLIAGPRNPRLAFLCLGWFGRELMGRVFGM